MTQHRRNQILTLVKNEGAAHVTELARKFGVSTVTIRNDLSTLEKAGALLRDRGGAIAAPASRQINSLPGLNERATLNPDAKQRIGKAAAQLVQPGDTIILDAGTTVVEMAPHLAGITPLTVVTNALNVALTIAADDRGADHFSRRHVESRSLEHGRTAGRADAGQSRGAESFSRHPGARPGERADRYHARDRAGEARHDPSRPSRSTCWPIRRNGIRPASSRSPRSRGSTP